MELDWLREMTDYRLVHEALQQLRDTILLLGGDHWSADLTKRIACGDINEHDVTELRDRNMELIYKMKLRLVAVNSLPDPVDIETSRGSGNAEAGNG